MDDAVSDATCAQSSALADLSCRQGLPAPLEDYVTAADGAKLRYAFWRASAAGRQGAVLCLNGRTEFIEKTIDVYAILWRSGLDVWALDWRGQGLSARALPDPQKGHVTDYQLYLDDLHRFLSDVDLGGSTGKTLMLAHSMGGHIGLRYLHDHPGLFDAAAFSAPMIDIPVNKRPLRVLNRTIVAAGFGTCYALSTGPFKLLYQNPADPTDNGRLEDYRGLIDGFSALSHDAQKRMEIERMVRETPALALGGPTAAWLDATFRSIALTRSPGYAEAIQTPILIVGGGRDRVVVNAGQEAMAARLPNGRYHLIADGAHELLVECDDVRQTFLEAFAGFADIALSLPPADMGGCVRP